MSKFLDKALEEIQQNNEVNAAASITGIDSPHTRKEPLKYYDDKEEDKEEVEEADEINERTKRIMIDVDQVLHSYEEGWKDGTLYGHLLPGAKEAIDELKGEYEIVIFTSRLSQMHDEDEINRQRELLSSWLTANEVYYDDMTADKRPAEFYIDDKALRFEGNWEDILNKIKNI